MGKLNRYEKAVNWLKNNALIVIVLIIFVGLMGVLGLLNEWATFKKNYFPAIGDEEKDSLSTQIPDDFKDFPKSSEKKKEISPQTPKENGTSHISGRLIDKFGKGISGAFIIAPTGEKTETDENGQFSLYFRKEEGQEKIWVTFEKPGYGKKSRYVGCGQTNIVLNL